MSQDDSEAIRHKQIETLTTALSTVTMALHELTGTVGVIHDRLRRVENKTQGLSDRPAPMNCPKCHKRITSNTGGCPVCGHRF
jgi:hypothetical protein